MLARLDCNANRLIDIRRHDKPFVPPLHASPIFASGRSFSTPLPTGSGEAWWKDRRPSARIPFPAGCAKTSTRSRFRLRWSPTTARRSSAPSSVIASDLEERPHHTPVGRGGVGRAARTAHRAIGRGAGRTRRARLLCAGNRARLSVRAAGALQAFTKGWAGSDRTRCRRTRPHGIHQAARSVVRVLAVIPGCASWRRPEIQMQATTSIVSPIHGFARRRAPRNDESYDQLRRHEDRQAESGQMVQRLIDPDQPPEPLMLHRHVEGGDAKSLGAIDDEVDGKIDKGDEPEFWRDDQDQQHRHRRGGRGNAPAAAAPSRSSGPCPAPSRCSAGKKSATMCLAVRTSIHPTSGPTTTDDAMEGNDKLTPF